MLSKVVGKSKSIVRIQSRLLSNEVKSERTFKYFDNVDIKDNVAVVRFNGPGKMNTISAGMQQEGEKIFRDIILPNKDVKAVVFISSKPDNFIAGADIDMIKAFEDKSQLKDVTMKAHGFLMRSRNRKFRLLQQLMVLHWAVVWSGHCTAITELPLPAKRLILVCQR